MPLQFLITLILAGPIIFSLLTRDPRKPEDAMLLHLAHRLIAEGHPPGPIADVGIADEGMLIAYELKVPYYGYTSSDQGFCDAARIGARYIMTSLPLTQDAVESGMRTIIDSPFSNGVPLKVIAVGKPCTSIVRTRPPTATRHGAGMLTADEANIFGLSAR